MPSITGQSILVIGGSSGIGFAAAELAAQQGVRVAIASSSEARVTNAVSRLQKAVPSASISGHVCDLEAPEIEPRLEKLLTELTATAPLDHIVLTAGRFDLKTMDAWTADYLNAPRQSRVTTPMLLAKLAPRFLNKSYRSSLIFTTGAVADRPVKGLAVGAAYASLMFGLARNLAVDLAPLRVNLVSPGATNTEMWGDEAQRKQRAAFHAKAALLGKAGAPEEVAEAYVYLMRDSNATGICVNSSGGALVQYG